MASFCVADLTAGTGCTCRIDQQHPVGLPFFAWWRSESNDDNNALGPVLGEGYMNMRWMQYNPEGPVGWQHAFPTDYGKSGTPARPFKNDKWACYTETFAQQKDTLQVVTLP